MLNHYSDFLAAIKNTDLAPWAEHLPAQITAGLSEERYGDLAGWKQALEALPSIETAAIDLKTAVYAGSPDELTSQQQSEIREQLEKLIPWRKGPFHIHGTFIDTEWRSDWKWDRAIPHIEPLKGRTVLDVGCGNGYHCWRMYGEGASRVVGVDPSPRFIIQFLMLKHFIGQVPVDVLPVTLEQVPSNLQAFDTTFSMGVLYHRRSPMDHLLELKATLKPGGQLVLETLVIEGEEGKVLVPPGRYAMMNNVWFLPSTATLLQWLRKCGFKNPRLVDTNITSTKEQRGTHWMRFHSLEQFLDPNDQSKTAEGHPAPMRAIIVANT